jgi:Phage gp6-like head-tail connector protein
MLQRIKTILDIEDNRQDEVITIIMENVSNHLKALLGKEIPAELNYIVEEITVRRFNRLGTEGMKSEEVEGHSVTFYDLKDEFVPYEDVIDAYKADNGVTGRGKVLFI